MFFCQFVFKNTKLFRFFLRLHAQKTNFSSFFRQKKLEKFKRLLYRMGSKTPLKADYSLQEHLYLGFNFFLVLLNFLQNLFCLHKTDDKNSRKCYFFVFFVFGKTKSCSIFSAFLCFLLRQKKLKQVEENS